MKYNSKYDFKVPYNPWGFFVFFSVINILLTYFDLPLDAKIWTVFLGLVIPLFLILAAPPAPPGKQPSFFATPRAAASFPVSTGFLILFWAAAVVPRFWKLGSPDRWQGGDPVQYGFYAVEFLHHWTWKFFETFGQTPSLVSYFCCFFLKITGDPFVSIQLPGAVISLLTLTAGYSAARQFFPKFPSRIFLFLLAFNYWSFDLAAYLLPGDLLPLWEFICFYILGRWLNSEKQNHAWFWAGLLGFALGLGPFTFTAWPVLVPVIFIILFYRFGFSPALKNPAPLLGFISVFIISLAPFGWASWGGDFGGHLSKIGIWNDFSVYKFFSLFTRYISVLFWGGSEGQSIPPAGGFLNFFYGSLSFLGIIALLRRRQKLTLALLALSFILFSLPGILSNTLEGHRVLLLFPLLFLLCAAGIESLAAFSPPRRQTAVLLLLLFPPGAIDIARFYIPREAAHAAVLDENRRSYGILKSLSEEQGPGLIFPDLIASTHDYSLFYYTYFFNAALNPDLPAEKAAWCAVFTENHYQPFLAGEFPDSRWIAFPTEKEDVLSRHVLGLIPVTRENRARLLRWRDFYEFIYRTHYQILDLPNGKARRPILENLLEFHPRVPEDPFLQSCYFEKLVFNYSWEKTFHPEDDGTVWNNFSPVLRRSLEKGYRDVVLCEKFGRLFPRRLASSRRPCAGTPKTIF